MPRRNYAFDKRQKDIQKKQKQEEKLRRKLERRAAGRAATDEPDAGVADDSTADPDAGSELPGNDTSNG